jgi:hypothetical protein
MDEPASVESDEDEHGEARVASECVVNTTRVILHIDLDAFYAQVASASPLNLQVEEHRHPELAGRPIAVQQWNSLIAVGYAARKFGVKRFHTPKVALHSFFVFKFRRPWPFALRLPASMLTMWVKRY